MCEILVKAIDAVHIDPVKDQRGCYKRGYPVVVMDDGHPWGFEERLPKFVVIKIPLIPKEKVQKYIEQWRIFVGLDSEGIPKMETQCRRLWKIRWDDLPQVAKDKLKTGQLIIRATLNYTGTYDFTWTQVKSYFRNLQTNLDETEELI